MATKRFTKDDIVIYDGVPAINVKVRNFPQLEGYSEQSLQWAWEAQCEVFWDEVGELIQHYLASSFGGISRPPRRYPNYSQYFTQNGRSGGWLEFHNLPDVESWDAIKVSAWGRLKTAIRKQIDWLMSEEQVKELIDINEWNGGVE